ncbi:TetR/AcrR family transcriptional regulator [Paenibacillus doosanensis]|uniref:Division inhibitor protein n=1 Tax=Paenibacillus konkukensis TaxID=2020716 RepID=A0ABY4RGY2_9BACL|nr:MULTISPECIES: TetR/AcrR family transcriptional regulator [Paenibacillus]MCS7461971.1 TetR/AcrR family transcriptional regulator [Paenibacillus doosanensis]UQZ81482.1 division inhibitor protein [Paenibacillus konkukensis]
MKDRIMRAFIEEIHDKGIKFTMDDLARRLGISKRTLYEHFSSKAELLEAIIAQTLEEADEKTEKIVSDPGLSLMDKIKGVMTVLPNHYELYDLRILEQMKRYYPEQWVKIDSALKDDWNMLRDLIEQGMQEGLIIKQNLSLVMKLIVDATNATLDQRFFMKNNITVTEALASIVEVLLFGLVPRDQ